MINEDGLFVDERTGEILEKDNRIGKTGLYAPLGIPAYQVLARAKEHAAKDVLTALLTFRRMNSNHVYPSQQLLMALTGRGKEKVISGTKALEAFGFVRVKKLFYDGNMHNHYFIQDSCYHTNQMNQKAHAFVVPVGSCLVCAKTLYPGDYKNRGGKIAHWGCSGNIAKVRAKRISPMRGKGASGSKD